MNIIATYERINDCETVEQLKQTIIDIWGEDGMIQGRTEPFSIKDMIRWIDMFVDDYKAHKGEGIYRALPTRKFGIRQQLLLILVRPHK